ncbi:S8/S53 family peptidase [Lentzea sp. NPDC004782]|uniref:S8 family peptidase n=1 Tax=Lentzea sp. NPDC004782 TaxID=3154458 RepID=UPI0033A593FC
MVANTLFGGRDPYAAGRPTMITGSPVRIGVVDTGIAQPQHPFLNDGVSGDPEPDDLDENLRGHGTFVTGVVLLNAPGAEVRMRAVVSETSGKREDEQVAEAIMELVGEVDLINLSFGGATWEHTAPPALQEAIETALSQEVVVVAAAANNASPLRNYPAALPGVISVGAATADGRVAEFSSFGSWLTVYARGEDVKGPYQAGWATWEGTSFAAATVTGRIAWLMAEKHLSAQVAADQLLSKCREITVHDVNGERTAKYLV